jgi:hypothetical protein
MVKTFERNQKLLGLSILIPYLSALQSEMVTQELLKAVRELLEQDRSSIFKWSRSKDNTQLMELAPYLPAQIKEKLLLEVQTMLDLNSSASNWQDLESILFAYLPESQRDEEYNAILANSRGLSAWQNYLHDLKKCLIGNQPRKLSMDNNLAVPITLKNESQLQTALIKASLLQDQADRASVLVVLASHLSESLLEKILVIVQAVQNEDKQVKLLVSLAPHLSELLLSKTLTAMQAIKHENSRAVALIGLIPCLSELLLEKALVIARELKEEELREKALVNLISKLPNSLQLTVLEETLATIQTRCEKQWSIEKEKSAREGNRIKDVKELQVEGIVNLAFLIPEPFKVKLLQKANHITKTIKDTTAKIIAIRLLIPHLLTAQLEELLPTVKALKDEPLLAEIIVKIVKLDPHASISLLKEGLNAAQGLVNRTKKAETLIGNQQLSAHQKKAEILIALAPYLKYSYKLLDEALSAAREIEDIEPRISAIAALACSFPNLHRQRFLKEVIIELIQNKITITNNEDYFIKQILNTIAPYISDELLENTFKIVNKINNLYFRIEAMFTLCSYLPEPQQAKLFVEKIQIYSREEISVIDFLELMSRLPKSLLTEKTLFLTDSTEMKILIQSQQAKLFLNKIQITDVERISTLDFIRLISHFPTSPFLNRKKFRWAQQLAIEAWNEFIIAKREKSYFFIEPKAVEMIFLISSFPDLLKKTSKKELTEGVSVPLLEDVLCQRLEVAINIENENLLPLLEDVLSETLAVVIRMDDGNRVKLLNLLEVYLSKLSSITLFPLWCDTLHTLARRTRKELLSDLSALTPVIKSLGGTQAIEETAYAIQDAGRWWS